MKKIEIEIPEGKRAEWVGGVLTLVDEPKAAGRPEDKYKEGDKVEFNARPGQARTVVSSQSNGYAQLYTLDDGTKCTGVFLSPWTPREGGEPLDITGRIKTFRDACDWCDNNNYSHYVTQFGRCGFTATDVDAYLKLRVIAAALNEGWEPAYEEGEQRWFVEYDLDENGWDVDCESAHSMFSPKILFKSERLAFYAIDHFADVYADFCGCKGARR